MCTQAMRQALGRRTVIVWLKTFHRDSIMQFCQGLGGRLFIPAPSGNEAKAVGRLKLNLI